MYEKEILLSSKTWINDIIVNVCQILLKSQHKEKGGFQNTLYGRNYQFKPLEGDQQLFVQILHVHNNHWVTVTNINCPSGCIDVYDSMYNFIKLDTMLQISSFVRSNDKFLQFRLVNVKRQPDSYSCGQFAIATAVELANGNEPALCNWTVHQMRTHIIQCFQDQRMTPFPRESRARRLTSKNRFLKTEKEEVHCYCRMINDPNREMVQCEKCNRWYHCDCARFNKDSAKELFYCKTCL